MKKISIIIPCFNHAEFLAETLNSVLSQTYKNWECIVVNDGSTDNTEEIVSNYCRKDERIKYVSQRNMGVSAARNRGIQESDGYFILPLDGDDIIDSTYIEKAVCYFEENPQTTLVYCKADFSEQKTVPGICQNMTMNLSSGAIVFSHLLFIKEPIITAPTDITPTWSKDLKTGIFCFHCSIRIVSFIESTRFCSITE